MHSSSLVRLFLPPTPHQVACITIEVRHFFDEQQVLHQHRAARPDRERILVITDGGAAGRGHRSSSLHIPSASLYQIAGLQLGQPKYDATSNKRRLLSFAVRGLPRPLSATISPLSVNSSEWTFNPVPLNGQVENYQPPPFPTEHEAIEGLKVWLMEPLGTYQLFQQATPAEETVWSNITRGLSVRDYKLVLQQFMDAYGREKSTISERFVEASRKKLEALMTRSLHHVQICALLVDGTIFKGQHLIVAIGIDAFGNKLVLGLVQGASENAKVVSGLFDHLCERGLDFSQPRLYLIDGSRALRAAIERHAGQAAFLQRCQVHKIRNVLAYVPETHQHWFKYKLRLAYAHADISDARQALYRLHDELNELNPSAAASLMEGLQETLRLHDLQVHARLRRSLSSTNGIESSIGTGIVSQLIWFLRVNISDRSMSAVANPYQDQAQEHEACKEEENGQNSSIKGTKRDERKVGCDHTRRSTGDNKPPLPERSQLASFRESEGGNTQGGKEEHTKPS